MSNIDRLYEIRFCRFLLVQCLVMGIAESLTVDRKTREIALLCKNRTIKLWTWFQPVFKLLFRGFRQFKLKTDDIFINFRKSSRSKCTIIFGFETVNTEKFGPGVTIQYQLQGAFEKPMSL